MAYAAVAVFWKHDWAEQPRAARGSLCELPLHAAHGIGSWFDVLPMSTLGRGSKVSEISPPARAALLGIPIAGGGSAKFGRVISGAVPEKRTRHVAFVRRDPYHCETTNYWCRMLRACNCQEDVLMLLKTLGASAIFLFVV